MERSEHNIIPAPPHLRAIRKSGPGGGHVLLLAVDPQTLQVQIFLVGSEWARIDSKTESGGAWFDATDFELAFDDAGGRITALTLHEVLDRFINRWKESK